MFISDLFNSCSGIGSDRTNTYQTWEVACWSRCYGRVLLIGLGLGLGLRENPRVSLDQSGFFVVRSVKGN